MPQNLSLTFLGGAGTVTGSKTLVNFNGQKVLIDCGLFQGIKRLRQQNWEDLNIAKSISDVVLTHAHLDHCGYLPRLVKQGFAGPIHCTPITARLAEIILLDSAKIQEEDAEEANRKQYSKHHPAKPLYDTKDVKRCLKLFHTHEFGEWMVPGADLRFTFHANGHIPGSAMVEMHAGKKLLVFSGDVGRLSPLVMSKPKPLPTCDLLVLESTYGDRLHSGVSAFDQLEKTVNIALRRRGQVLIPSFAVERSQEIIYVLISLMNDKRIPRVKIYLDSPMAAAVTSVLRDYYHFLKNPDLQDELSNQLEIVSDHHASRSVVYMSEPKIVIAGSGMITGGRILHHLAAHLSDPKTMVILPGYQAPGTRGHQLATGAPEVKFFGQFHKVKAEIAQLQGLSAHADRGELVEWIRKSKQLPGRIVLNHGEPEASDSLRVKLEHEFNTPVSLARQGMELVLDF
ncbi:MAG: MBL fold metallo-hydrolase [Owenweeksia sp.]|nr:MBL fold metallo-hydrolase [Owenweeksia sp.]